MLGLIISLDVLTDGIAQGLELLLIDVVCAAAPPIKDLNWVRTRLSVDLGVVPCRGPQYPPKTVGVIKNGASIDSALLTRYPRYSDRLQYRLQTAGRTNNRISTPLAPISIPIPIDGSDW